MVLTGLEFFQLVETDREADRTGQVATGKDTSCFSHMTSNCRHVALCAMDMKSGNNLLRIFQDHEL